MPVVGAGSSGVPSIYMPPFAPISSDVHMPYFPSAGARPLSGFSFLLLGAGAASSVAPISSSACTHLITNSTTFNRPLQASNSSLPVLAVSPIQSPAKVLGTPLKQIQVSTSPAPLSSPVARPATGSRQHLMSSPLASPGSNSSPMNSPPASPTPQHSPPASPVSTSSRASSATEMSPPHGPTTSRSRVSTNTAAQLTPPQRSMGSTTTTSAAAPP